MTFIIADNQDITRVGLHGYISFSFPDAAVRDVTCKIELVAALADCGGDAVVVIDYALFDIGSADELLVMVRRFSRSRWLVFSNDLGDRLVRRLAPEHGIGMLLKECDGDEISRALRSSVVGDDFHCRQIKEMLASTPEPHAGISILTATEREILCLIAHGLSVKEIAARRISSVHTITTHKKNIFRKLEINNVYEATRYALRAGLVEMSDYYI